MLSYRFLTFKMQGEVILTWQPKLEEYEKIITLSMAIEASLEACFQFWFQTNFLLPSVILGIIEIDGADQITDLVNFRIFPSVPFIYTSPWKQKFVTF